MTKYSSYNIIYRLQKWMDSVSGQTFMNYAYSWGAAVVILGTLFKLTHLPGANAMLFIGMGTEVFVFFISAFDRPFDKTQEGRNLATDTELAAALAAQEAVENGIEATSGNAVSENIAVAATSGNLAHLLPHKYLAEQSLSEVVQSAEVLFHHMHLSRPLLLSKYLPLSLLLRLYHLLQAVLKNDLKQKLLLQRLEHRHLLLLQKLLRPWNRLHPHTLIVLTSLTNSFSRLQLLASVFLSTLRKWRTSTVPLQVLHVSMRCSSRLLHNRSQPKTRLMLRHARWQMKSRSLTLYMLV